MTRRTTRRRPPGAWRRFFSALVALIVVLVGVPALLVLFARLGLDSSHPFPRIGTTDEIKAYFERDLTPTEVAPIAMRALLIAGWLLWAAMVVSVWASILEARGSGLRTALPKFVLFAGMGRWIAAGLTAMSALAPNFVSAASLASPRPFTVSSATAAAASDVDAPVAPGFARVQRGESVETFAQRTLGDPSRWTEIWQLNRDQAVGREGEIWSVAWKLSAGWDLRLPAGAPNPSSFAGSPGAAHRVPASGTELPEDTDTNAEQASRHDVVAGDSYWSIARSRLGDAATGPEVWDYTQLLIEANASRFDYEDPAMLRPGDVVELVGTPAAAVADPASEPTGPTPTVPQVTVAAGESYWTIADDTLGADATTQDVLDLTGDLVDLNSPMLAYDDRRMIRPGDTVFLQDPAAFASDVVEPTVLATAPTVDVPEDDRVDPNIDAVTPTGGTPAPTTTPATTTTTTTTTTVPAPVPADPAADTNIEGSRPSRSPIGVGEAALLATGIVALLAARRRARLRAAELPARLPLPRPDSAATERMLRRLEDGERLLRVDIALRAAAAAIADTEHRVVVVRSGPDGTIEFTMSGSVSLDEPWIGSDRRWTLPRLVAVDDLAAQARTVGVPCIALVQIGVDEDGWDVLVDLEAVALLAVDAEATTADAVVRAVAVGLATSEFAEIAHLVGVGVDRSVFLGHRQAQTAGSLDEGIELAATLVGTTVAAKRSTFALRARHTGGEMWEPAVVLVASAEAIAMTPNVASSLYGRSGVAMVAGGSLPGALWTLRPDGQHWSLDPLGLRLTPVGIDPEQLTELVDAIDSDPIEVDVPPPVGADASSAPYIAEQHALLVADPHLAVVDVSDPGFDKISIPPSLGVPDPLLVPIGNGDANGHNETNGHLGTNGQRGSGPGLPFGAPSPDAPMEEFHDPNWSMMVRLIGTVDLVDAAGNSAKFERSKTLELLAWMVTHRQGSTRMAARTALWDQDVRDATFANVVSEARRVMARQVEPPEDDEWLRRTLTDKLTLHDGVVCDADLVRARFDLGRTQSGDAALRTLRPAIELINDLPFTGTSYLWPETEGIASNLVVLATNVTAEYAKRALAIGDFEGVFWSTGQGLKVIAGQEGLIALRMRAHAQAGDLSGVRHEWDSYERVINADPWSDGEPAPKLIALRKELLSR